MRLDHAIAQFAEDADRVGANFAVLLDHEDRLRSAFSFHRRHEPIFVGAQLPGLAAEEQADGRPLAFGRFDLDMPVRLLGEAIDHREPGSLAYLLGREERVEHLCHRLR